MKPDEAFRPKQIPSFIPKGVPDYSGVPEERSTDAGSLGTPNSDSHAGSPQLASSSSLLPDLSPYDLTIGEALELFPQERRKCPSDRTLQRYCQDGRFDCYKLKTTRNGTPVHEWIINSASLLKFIRSKPEIADDPSVSTPVLDGDAGQAQATSKNEAIAPFDMATPKATGDADADLGQPRSLNTSRNDIATPNKDGDADASVVSQVDLLVENAKLTATLDAQNELIGELRADKSFMRDQISHQRKNDTLMADMHRETLHALKAVSVAGRHTRIEMPDTPPLTQKGDAIYDGPIVDQSPRPPESGV